MVIVGCLGRAAAVGSGAMRLRRIDPTNPLRKGRANAIDWQVCPGVPRVKPVSPGGTLHGARHEPAFRGNLQRSHGCSRARRTRKASAAASGQRSLTAEGADSGRINKKALPSSGRASNWVQGLDLNQRPSGYEPDELPGCSTLQRRAAKRANRDGFCQRAFY
jgi:hypothetical protein